MNLLTKRKIVFTKQVQGTRTLALAMAMEEATMTETEALASLPFSLGLELSDRLLYWSSQWLN